MLFGTVALSGLVASPQEQEMSARAAFASAIYASNVWFQMNASDYFGADASSNPFLHTWSLAVEEQFYLIWPMLLLLTTKLFRSKRAIVISLFSVSVASFASCI